MTSSCWMYIQPRSFLNFGRSNRTDFIDEMLYCIYLGRYIIYAYLIAYLDVQFSLVIFNIFLVYLICPSLVIGMLLQYYTFILQVQCNVMIFRDCYYFDDGHDAAAGIAVNYNRCYLYDELTTINLCNSRMELSGCI